MMNSTICHKVSMSMVLQLVKNCMFFPVKIFCKGSKNLQEENSQYEFKLDQYNMNESINTESANETINDLAEAGIFI